MTVTKFHFFPQLELDATAVDPATVDSSNVYMVRGYSTRDLLLTDTSKTALDTKLLKLQPLKKGMESGLFRDKRTQTFVRLFGLDETWKLARRLLTESSDKLKIAKETCKNVAKNPDETPQPLPSPDVYWPFCQAWNDQPSVSEIAGGAAAQAAAQKHQEARTAIWNLNEAFSKLYKCVGSNP